MDIFDLLKSVLANECKCLHCQEVKVYAPYVLGNTKPLWEMSRSFDAKINRIGRKYGVPNKRLLRPMVGIMTEKGLLYARVPYELC